MVIKFNNAKFILFLLLFQNCSTNSNEQINNASQTNLTTLILDKFDTWNSLILEVQNVLCANSTPQIQFKNKLGQPYSFVPINGCQTNAGIKCYVRRNYIKIVKDKILIKEEFPISEICKHLKSHYYNYDKSPYYSESINKAFISVNCSNCIQLEIINLFQLILDCHYKLNTQPEIKILLESSN